ncbi:hypothetical protein AXX17_AT3G43490 [Arabidopsis thaliana]|uniref:Cathepsin propeptide inhibitor domain-containing protein n=1 Tax=Arabidopsis thaliana TaxID=3702 RepID=A0A178V793_ARATH|nr:hypothetical protein AXX17_AT3G43490 [Arabidopsis thaliana]
MTSIVFFLLAILLSSRTSGVTSRGGLFEASAVEKHEQWMSRFNRVYSDDSEKTSRFEIFTNNLKFVESFNMNTNKTYTLDVNEFSDLTDEEFKARYTGLVVPEGMTRISTTDSHETVSLDMKTLVKPVRAWIGYRKGLLHPLSTNNNVVIY